MMHTGRSDERIPDAGPYHIAYADVRPTCSSVELSVDVAMGSASPRLRRRLIDAVFDLDVMRTPRTLLANLPLGDVDLLDCVSQHLASVHTRAAGHSCLV